MIRIALAAAPLLVLALAACSDGGTSGSGGQTSTTSTSICAADAGALTYAVGLAQAATDGKVTVTFADADPAPPAKGLNELTIDVTDDMGKPIEGATITVKACMPLHGHCATTLPKITAGAQAGRYVIDQVDLFMPGLWAITFTVTPNGGAADPVTVSFCIEG